MRNSVNMVSMTLDSLDDHFPSDQQKSDPNNADNKEPQWKHYWLTFPWKVYVNGLNKPIHFRLQGSKGACGLCNSGGIPIPVPLSFLMRFQTVNS
jgi:hypothetical protein